MYIAYYDESGDDGYPRYSSPLFVLSVTYLHYLNWKDVLGINRDTSYFLGINRDTSYFLGINRDTSYFLK